MEILGYSVLGFVYWFFCFGYTLARLKLFGEELSVSGVLSAFFLGILIVPYRLGADLCLKLNSD